MNRASVTIVVPAYNEADRLRSTVEEALSAARDHLEAFELIIVNDGSSDGTDTVSELLATQYDEVDVIHHPTNQGVGAAYAAALARATHPFITLIPGDKAFEASGVAAVFKAAGAADMVISYRHNMQEREPLRRLLSIICTRLIRLATRCPIRDGHSLFVWPVSAARSISFPKDYRYHEVSLIRLFSILETYTEVPVTLTPQSDASSGTIRFGFLLKFSWKTLKMIFEARLRGDHDPPQYIPPPDIDG